MTYGLISPERVDVGENPIFDFIGVGFGPSNLSLAIAASEIDPSRTLLFFEQNAAFQWHPGMLIEGARMQISFLKDLATLRNIESRFTFLQFMKAKGRLEPFVNLNDFHPTRLEYQEYLRWAAESFAGMVRYATAVKAIRPVKLAGDDRCSLFRVEAQNADTGRVSVHFAKNLVYAPGGSPRLPEGRSGWTRRVIHSSQFLPGFPEQFANTSSTYEFVVVGGGQSGGEIVAYLLNHYPRARVHLVISGYALRTTESSRFANEHFFASSANAFHAFSAEKRSALVRELRATNYGVVEAGLLEAIYRTAYADLVKGQQRLFIHSCSRLASVTEDDSGVHATVEDRFADAPRTLRCDGVILATGYERTLDPAIFADLLPVLAKDETGNVELSSSYRARTNTEMDCALYVQGVGEQAFGLGDTLLSLLPVRAARIFEDGCANLSPASERARRGQKLKNVDYPPKRHREDDPEKLYAVIERFKFATVISTSARGDPLATHVPLILDRTRGAKGTLFGHMDRANAQVDTLATRRVLAIFHGPNAYISPHVYETNQLPTWNSINVHVRGRARILTDAEAVVRGLCSIAEQADARRGAYRLDPADPRIERLIDFIVGFEIEIDEIVGRFKLSQDRNDSDRHRAAVELARSTDARTHELVELAVGFPIQVERGPE